MKWKNLLSWKTVDQAQRLGRNSLNRVRETVEDSLANGGMSNKLENLHDKTKDSYKQVSEKTNGAWQTMQKNEFVGKIAEKSKESQIWASEKSSETFKDVQKSKTQGNVSDKTSSAWEAIRKTKLAGKVSDVKKDGQNYVTRKSSDAVEKLQTGDLAKKTMENMESWDQNQRNQKKDFNNKHKFSVTSILGENFITGQTQKISDKLAISLPKKFIVNPLQTIAKKNAEKNWWEFHRGQRIYAMWKDYWERKFGRVTLGVLNGYWRRNETNFQYIAIGGLVAYAFFYGFGYGIGAQLGKDMIVVYRDQGSDRSVENFNEKSFGREKESRDSFYRVHTKIDEI